MCLIYKTITVLTCCWFWIHSNYKLTSKLQTQFNCFITGKRREADLRRQNLEIVFTRINIHSFVVRRKYCTRGKNNILLTKVKCKPPHFLLIEIYR